MTTQVRSSYKDVRLGEVFTMLPYLSVKYPARESYIRVHGYAGLDCAIQISTGQLYRPEDLPFLSPDTVYRYERAELILKPEMK